MRHQHFKILDLDHTVLMDFLGRDPVVNLQILWVGGDRTGIGADL